MEDHVIRLEPGDLTSLNANDRDIVLLCTKHALLKVSAAMDLVPRTAKGIEARNALKEAADWLLDLREGIKTAKEA